MPVRAFLLISVILMGFDQPRLVKTKVTDDITVSIPRGWRPMDNLDFTDRYPSVRAPLAAYTNEERLTDFSVNISATRWPDTNNELAQEFFKASISNMFDKVEFISEGIRTVGGKEFIYFEFISRVNGSRDEANRSPVLKYTCLQYFLAPERTLVFSFNCPHRQRENWQSTARAMMKSIKIK